MSQEHALIIDDNTRNIQVLVRLLEGQAVHTTELSDPRRLEDILPNLEPVDVVFLDLEMPMLNGFQVLDRLKNHPDFVNVPIIAYTVHVSEMHVAHQHGFDGFIGKPLDSERFPQQLARILDGEGVWETV